MSSRFLLFLASAGAAASLHAQGMALGLPLVLGGVSPLAAAGEQQTATPGAAEGLPLDSPEAEACLASARQFNDLWFKNDYAGLFRWLPASRQESVRKIEGAFFTQFDAELADELAGLFAEAGAALKGNADLLLRTVREKWAGNPVDDSELTSERIASFGDRLCAFAALSRADLAQGRVEALLEQLGALHSSIADRNVYDGVSIRSEVLGIRSSAADGSFGVETRLCYGGDGLSFARTNETKMVLFEGVWMPSRMVEGWTDEATDRIVSEQIPELMSEIAEQRDSALASIRKAREAARRMAAAGTVDEMNAAGRAFAEAAFSIGDEDEASSCDEEACEVAPCDDAESCGEGTDADAACRPGCD